MRCAGLEEAQAGIKIARRNISNLRYADDTTLMAESEEELKPLDEGERGEWKSWLHAAVHGVTKNGTRLSDWKTTTHFLSFCGLAFQFLFYWNIIDLQCCVVFSFYWWCSLMHKFLMLMKSNLSSFSFVVCTFGVIHKNPFPLSWRFKSMLSSRNLYLYLIRLGLWSIFS